MNNLIPIHSDVIVVRKKHNVLILFNQAVIKSLITAVNPQP